MESFIEYVNSALPEKDKRNNGILFKFKKKTLDEMTQRAIEVSARGLNDRKVVEDLIISEHSDLAAEYEEYYKKATASQRAKRAVIMNVVGSLIYLLTLVVVYLGLSFATQAWNMTWAIIVDGILLWVVYLLSLGIKKFTAMKRIFHIFARILLGGAIIITTVAVYLLLLAVTDNTVENRWLVLIFGLIGMIVCDGAYASLAHHRLAILNWLLYVPVIATFVFIVIGASALMPWNVAWLIIPLSLLVDFVICFTAISRNKHDKMEVADTWNEN